MENITLYRTILESNLINFIIMVSILVLIFKKAKLGKIIDRMADDTKNSVMTSIESAKAAMSEYKEARKTLRNLETEKETIISKAQSAAENLKKGYEEAAKKEEEKLLKRCDAEIAGDKGKFKTLTAAEVLEKVRKRTGEEILRRLNDEEGISVHKKLIENSIEELDKLDGRVFTDGV